MESGLVFIRSYVMTKEEIEKLKKSREEAIKKILSSFAPRESNE